MTYDRNKMSNQLLALEKRIAVSEEKGRGIREDMKDQRRMLEKIVDATNEIQQSVSYWKGKNEQV